MEPGKHHSALEEGEQSIGEEGELGGMWTRKFSCSALVQWQIIKERLENY